jgi:hypothetical protein
MAIALGISTAHPMGESATRPCVLLRSALVVLILLAGARLPRGRALPARCGIAHPGTSKAVSKVIEFQYTHGFQLQLSVTF